MCIRFAVGCQPGGACSCAAERVADLRFQNETQAILWEMESLVTTKAFMIRTFGAGLSLAAIIITGCSLRAAPAPPRYDHVVIAIEENKDADQVMESPYLSSLAAGGLSFSRMFGIVHPSQPNYFVLFSGSTQGVTDDGLHDLSTPNLANSLSAAGLSFATYSEGLPAAGDTVEAAGRYVRKHNPCASFTNIPHPETVNLPWTAFPADFTKLPAASFVIPNLDNDMHDGTVAAGDGWLQANLGTYASWAASHNSLFIVTFDECDGAEPPATTPIATIFSGANLSSTVYQPPANLYSILRMIEDIYQLPRLGEEGTAPAISGIWR